MMSSIFDYNEKYKIVRRNPIGTYDSIHAMTLAAKTSSLTRSGAPTRFSLADDRKAVATLSLRWASLASSVAKKATIPKLSVPWK